MNYEKISIILVEAKNDIQFCGSLYNIFLDLFKIVLINSLIKMSLFYESTIIFLIHFQKTILWQDAYFLLIEIYLKKKKKSYLKIEIINLLFDIFSQSQ